MLVDVNIDKTNWVPVKFGDVVREVRESTANPEAEGLHRIVGLEHIEPENTHLNNWGELADSITFSRIFRKGQMLFGKRRPYLKKAALAGFDGICSGDIIVMEAKEDILPGLLPFLVCNDKFFEHAVKTSAGSLSPRTKFKDLAEYEFLLPPIEQQAELAELLWAGDEMIEKEKNLLESLKDLSSIYTSNLIWKANLKNAELKLFADKSLGKFVDGDWIESKDQSEDGIRLLQLADIGVNEFINKSSRYISDETFKRLKCFEVLPGDILIARMPDPIGRACRVLEIGKRMITAVDCCIVRVDENKNHSDYLLHLLNSQEFLSKANSLASGSTRQRVSKKVLESVTVPIPNREMQITIANKLNSILRNTTTVSHKIDSGRLLQKSLINQIF